MCMYERILIKIEDWHTQIISFQLEKVVNVFHILWMKQNLTQFNINAWIKGRGTYLHHLKPYRKFSENFDFHWKWFEVWKKKLLMAIEMNYAYLHHEISERKKFKFPKTYTTKRTVLSRYKTMERRWKRWKNRLMALGKNTARF